MIKAGCIPFVPSSGGQIEIIGKNNSLTFKNKKEAVQKIVNVLSNSKKQKELQNYLLKRRNLFSEKRFMKEIQVIVENFFQNEEDIIS